MKLVEFTLKGYFMLSWKSLSIQLIEKIKSLGSTLILPRSMRVLSERNGKEKNSYFNEDAINEVDHVKRFYKSHLSR